MKDVSARRAVVDDDDDDMMTDSSDDGDEDDMMSGGASAAPAPAAAAPAGDLLGDLLSDLGGSSAPAPAAPASAGGAFPADLVLGPLVSPKAGSGCGLKGAMMLNADLAIALEVHNRTGAAFSTFMIKVRSFYLPLHFVRILLTI